MELDFQKWCYFALCEPVLWQNVRMKDLFEGGFVEGCAEKRKFLFVLGATPNLVLSPNFCFEREFIFVWENNLGVLEFGHCESVLIPYYVFFIFVSENLFCCWSRLKVELHKFLASFLVGYCVYFLVKFSSFLLYIWWRLLKVYNIFTINFAWNCYLEAFPITIW